MTIARAFTDTPTLTRADREARTEELFERLAGTTSEAERQQVIDEIVVTNLPLSEALARRYAGRGIDLDDLEQVARMGLVCAVQRFRTGRAPFVAFAVPTITGELKRHFRASWMVRPPRRLQESPGDEATSAFRPVSLDVAATREDGTTPFELSTEDHDLELIPDLITLHRAMKTLSAVERRVLTLRFVEDLPQAEIGRRVGVSQMQVSRILSRVLAGLRAEMEPMAA